MAGIIETIKFAGTLVLALPAALAGLELLLLRGQTGFGVALLGLAVGLVIAQHWLTMPTDIPELLAERVMGTIAKEPDAEGDDEP
ncbi:hypothetical protein C488_04802 [Natrinema pellirubrum DSM 15624]|uniref:Uncharacterized protein n=1 Tax=Natrinema pellirubrum (strain DSM 15624 / CIP 106293 / JCM 10476 / NCIMB 786 / 157) TaxID=797303 RepID=L0JFP7_NATP1|nr:hypothetical protein [Natrinema pellirubrum]AGB30335.1 hypothetical protein Natpe_0404 [Natrinema pellirubrum DSM 15624]ELY79285.1 hypothetical protein C488_04802 [Natrinema pellirubrum DSM 15624]